MEQLVLQFEVPIESEAVRPPRSFDFSRVKLNPSRGDIMAACVYWERECKAIGLEVPQKSRNSE